jgi:hypothetical protein
MSAEQIQTLIVGALQGLGASTVFLLALFIGFCTLLGFPKLRPGGRLKRVIRSLDELEGGPSIFLLPNAPRGPIDQLKGPELFPPTPRKSEG